MNAEENSSSSEMKAAFEEQPPGGVHRKKSRMVVQKGLEFVPLFVKDIVLIYTENKLTYVLDKLGRKYISEKNLSDVASQLDKERFFRANRQYIVNMEYIR